MHFQYNLQCKEILLTILILTKIIIYSVMNRYKKKSGLYLMRTPRYKIFLAFMDWIIMIGCFAVGLRLRFKPYIDIIDISSLKVINELSIFAALSLFMLLVFDHNQMYNYHIFTNNKHHFLKISKSIFSNLFVFVVIGIYISDISKMLDSRLFMIYFIALTYVAFIIYRIFIFSNIFRYIEKMGVYRRNVIVYGSGTKANEVYESITNGNRWDFLGFVSEGVEAKSGVNILGDLNEIKKIQKKVRIDNIIIAIDEVEHDRLMDIISYFQLIGIRTFIIADLYEVLHQYQPIEVFNGLPLVSLNYSPTSYYYRYVKRLLDIMLSLFGILMLSPVFVVISLIIKFTSKGPILFSQNRVGKDGKEFKFYKFRSMYVDNDSSRHQKFISDFINGKDDSKVKKIVNDPRVTPIGGFIRKTSLDELPQLFNVLKGDMSLVGPRPSLPYEYKMFKDWHKTRFLVKPGCTGVWQVSGRSQVSFEEMIVMDYYYINNISLWGDIKLILKTIPVMIFGDGAY